MLIYYTELQFIIFLLKTITSYMYSPPVSILSDMTNDVLTLSILIIFLIWFYKYKYNFQLKKKVQALKNHKHYYIFTILNEVIK